MWTKIHFPATSATIASSTTFPPFAADAATKAVAAKNADAEAQAANAEIERMDALSEEQIAPGAVEKAVAMIWERYRSESAEEELGEIMSGVPADEDGEPVNIDVPGIVEAALAGETRKYCVLDRSFDRVDQVANTSEAQVKFEKSRAEYAGLIREMAERLRRIHSPVKNRLQLNVENGRLDPRKAHRVGLGLRGVPVDLAKVWRATTTRIDPKFAVTLLLDCSGSMSSPVSGGTETHISVAQKSAAALSEVLRSIGIPHEILGHTTQSDRVHSLIKSGEISKEDVGEFSRVTPFQGLIFKGFNENAVPAAVFGNFSLQDNLDGEALLWAAQRLAARPEKTKLLISISDGMPQAHMANTGELERHLLTACKRIEAKEQEGMILFGIGIGEKRVTHFYRNADVLESVGDLPRAVMGIVERVLRRVSLMKLPII